MGNIVRGFPAEILVLDKSITPAKGAAAFINPLTTRSMVETMRAKDTAQLCIQPLHPISGRC